MTADLERAAELVSGGDVVAFTGAGISAESGIPTFRDPGGLRLVRPARAAWDSRLAVELALAAFHAGRSAGGRRYAPTAASRFATATREKATTTNRRPTQAARGPGLTAIARAATSSSLITM